MKVLHVIFFATTVSLTVAEAETIEDFDVYRAEFDKVYFSAVEVMQ